MIPLSDSLNLRAIHDQIHNLVLSRRKGVAFWENAFETAWAGLILSHHSPENRQDDIVNLIKGEVLGERRLAKITKHYDLAACYMMAVFLQSIAIKDAASEFVALAENFVNSNALTIEWRERFHFYSTSEYVYAASLVYDQMPNQLSPLSVSTLQKATNEFYINHWYDRSYIYALAASAHLRLNTFEPQLCSTLADFALNFQPVLAEDNISLLWFLESNWARMRLAIDDTNFIQRMSQYLIELRTRTFRFFPDFALEPLDIEKSRQWTTEQQLERGSDRIVNTVELLMLDEVAERHAPSTLVVTRDEWARRDTITTLFDQYRVRVDRALIHVSLTNRLEAIYQSLNSQNPASWSQAALSCRQVLYDLSYNLLQVPDTEYPYLPEDPKTKKPMSLARGKEKNRFAAYMHQTGIRSSTPLLVKQLEYLFNVLFELINETAAVGKKSPEPSYEEASSIVMQTYVFLGELERLTQFKVITEISPP